MQYHPFPSDYAANAFRAVSILAEHTDAARAATPTGEFSRQIAKQLQSPLRSRIHVATLAGFQGLDGAAQGRFSLVAAETRMMAQRPTYITLAALALFALLVAAWILLKPNGGHWVLSLARQLLNDPHLWPTHAKTRPAKSDLAGSLAPRWKTFWGLLLLAFSAAASALALWQLHAAWSFDPHCEQSCYDFALAHGRDGMAVSIIWLLYGCVAIVGLARISVLDRRLHTSIRVLSPAHMQNSFRDWTGAQHSWILPASTFALGMALLACSARPRISVDPTWPWWFALAVLTLGVAFFAHLVRQHRLQRRLSMSLQQLVSPVSRHVKGKWPTYLVSGEPPCTPFNLRLRRVLDFDRLVEEPFDYWVWQTRAIIVGEPLTHTTFEDWQARLVSELKLIATAIRTTAWCAMLAPVSVLLAINLYPPVHEEFLTGLCIVMLVGSFAMSVLVVLRMEADPMFGAMFTRDGDTLSFGGGLRALWPKFVAIGLVLLPLIAPDMWRWLHNLLRSMNSIQ